MSSLLDDTWKAVQASVHDKEKTHRIGAIVVALGLLWVVTRSSSSSRRRRRR